MESRKPVFLILVGLVVVLLIGCGSQSDLGDMSKSSMEPSQTATLSSRPVDTAVTSSVLPTPTPDSAAPDEHRPPPIVEEIAPPSPVESARADLAHRLHADVSLVTVVEVTSQTMNPEDLSCFTSNSTGKSLWTEPTTVGLITLSIKGNLHRYVALGDIILYCNE